MRSLNQNNKLFFKNNIFIISYLIVLLIIIYYSPILASRLSNNVQTYYLIVTGILTASLLPFIVTNRKILAKGATYGILIGLITYLIVLIVASVTSGVGRAWQNGKVPYIPLIFYIIYGYSLGLVISKSSTMIADESIALTIAGLASLIIPFTRGVIATGFTNGIVGVMISTYLLGLSAGFIARKIDLGAGTAYYAILMGLVAVGPVGIGGSLLLGGTMIGIGSLLGAYISLLLLDFESNINFNIKNINIHGNMSRRRVIGLLIIIILIISSIGLYMKGVMFWRPYAIVSGSMTPTINKGDLIILEKPGDLKIGDIISFHKSHSIVTHRIIDIHGNTLQTKGDANSAPDPYRVHKSDIIGKVWLRIPYAGWPLILVNWNNTVRSTLLLVSVALIAGIALWPGREEENRGK